MNCILICGLVLELCVRKLAELIHLKFIDSVAKYVYLT